MKRITVQKTLITILIACFFILVFGDDDCNNCYEAEILTIKFFLCGLVAIIVSLYYTMKYKEYETIIFNIENQPLLETNEATSDVSFSGTGKIVADRLIKSFDKKIPCVYYHYILEEYVKSGKNKTWKTITNVSEFVPFYIEDSRGKLKVDITNIDNDFSDKTIQVSNRNIPNPQNSEIDCEAILVKHKYKVKEDKNKGLFSKTRTYRKSEYILRPDTKVFAYGFISKKEKELVLREHEEHPLIISKKSHKEYIKDFYKGKNLIYYVHLIVLLGFATSVISINYYIKLHPFFITQILFWGWLIIGGSVVFTMYNRIIQLKNRAFNAKSNIDGELKRRYDLIPQIQEVANGFSVHEKDVQNLITEIRTNAYDNKKLNKSFIGLLEKYPDIKSSNVFKNVMTNLIDTEERIAYSREFYNRSIRKYNTLIMIFPFNLLASMFKIKKIEYLSFDKK